MKSVSSGGPDAVGAGGEQQNAWFVEERIHIGARCSGAMERLLTMAVAWSTERVQFGERIFDFQGVSFPLADSAADASAARLLTLGVEWATERVQFGERIFDFQGVSFPLANSAADASAARLLTR